MSLHLFLLASGIVTALATGALVTSSTGNAEDSKRIGTTELED
ncbi:MAG: hypothetical protein V4488_19480 [Pseudomonadota bacterium]